MVFTAPSVILITKLVKGISPSLGHKCIWFVDVVSKVKVKVTARNGRQLRYIDIHITHTYTEERTHTQRQRKKQNTLTKHAVQYHYHRLTACWQNLL